jgi:hypothetical protein
VSAREQVISAVIVAHRDIIVAAEHTHLYVLCLRIVGVRIREISTLLISHQAFSINAPVKCLHVSSKVINGLSHWR